MPGLDVSTIRSFLKMQPTGSDHGEKKLFKKIIGYLLRYNTMMSSLPIHKLHENTTYATNLTLPDGSLGGEALRVRIDGLLQPSINFVSRIVRSISASNGMDCRSYYCCPDVLNSTYLTQVSFTSSMIP